MPPSQDRVCILKAGLVDILDRPLAGFRDDFLGKSVAACPFFQQFHFGRNQVPSPDAEGFHNSIVSFAVLIQKGAGVFDCMYVLGIPVFCYPLHIVQAEVAFCNAVFNEKLDQFRGKVKLIVPGKNKIKIILIDRSSQIGFR